VECFFCRSIITTVIIPVFGARSTCLNSHSHQMCLTRTSQFIDIIFISFHITMVMAVMMTRADTLNLYLFSSNKRNCEM